MSRRTLCDGTCRAAARNRIMRGRVSHAWKPHKQEELMTHFRQTASLVAAALIAGATTANAQTTVITREPVQTQTIVTEQPLQLTPVQRRTIYRTIVRSEEH